MTQIGFRRDLWVLTFLAFARAKAVHESLNSQNTFGCFEIAAY